LKTVAASIPLLLALDMASTADAKSFPEPPTKTLAMVPAAVWAVDARYIAFISLVTRYRCARIRLVCVFG
jgi:hypothetical protein